MQRRDVLKMLPLTFAGMGVAGAIKSGWPEPAGTDSKPLVAQVKLHQGTPTLFLNNQPTFAGMCWVDPPAVEGWTGADYAGGIAKAGIHIYSFDAGKGYEWVEPRAGRSDPFDFSTVEARYGRIIDADPLALFHLRLHFEFEVGDWWLKAFPSECEITSEGRPQSESFASTVWRKQVNDFLQALIAHLKHTGLYDRITAFQPGAGGTGEWVKGETSMSWLCADYSEPMRQHFRSWLRREYGDDPARLRAAWNRRDITFETAEVPPAEQQLQTKLYTFRDPAQEQNVIDYFRCFADLSSDLVIDYCRTVKQATNGEKLAGAFYGYLTEMNNGGFHGERQESDYATYSRSGHLGLKKVLESPYVDFLVSPHAYGFRSIGGDTVTGQPPASACLHGKLLIVEDDSRTNINHDQEYGHTYTLSDSVAVLERDFARVAVQGLGMWWLSESINPVKEPAFGPLLESFHRLGNSLLQLDRSPSAEIAVLLDEESFYYENNRINLDLPMILQQQFWGLPRLGAPYDLYLLQDFVEGRMKPYKLYIFLNALRLDKNRRASLNKELRKGGRVALWIYGSGYIEDEPGLDHMRELTGFTFAKHMQPWGPQMFILDYTHPITKGLPQDLVWGTNNKLCPIFCLDDPEARVLGEVVFSRGNTKPGMGVKTFPEWTSIYVAAPNLPAPLLRGIAGFAGVHLYNREGDVLYASPDLLAVHTVAGGSRVFRLPRHVERVYDLFAHKAIAQDAAEFQAELRPASTSLFYTGGAALLSDLVGAR